MRIAVVDDDDTTVLFMDRLLADAGHHCSGFRNGRDLLTALQRDTFDLLVIDWAMPGISGLDVLKWARDNLPLCPPMIMLTNRSDKDDVAQCLNAGADDYIVKPEAGNVILARIEAVYRRTATQAQTARVETYGPYAFDRLTESATLADEPIALTSKEFALALLFFQNQHRALSRAYILETLWKSVADLPTRTLDMHISRIRSKLQLRPENGYRLQTIFGYGYRLETFEAEEE